MFIETWPALLNSTESAESAGSMALVKSNFRLYASSLDPQLHVAPSTVLLAPQLAQT